MSSKLSVLVLTLITLTFAGCKVSEECERRFKRGSQVNACRMGAELGGCLSKLSTPEARLKECLKDTNVESVANVEKAIDDWCYFYFNPDLVPAGEGVSYQEKLNLAADLFTACQMGGKANYEYREQSRLEAAERD